MYTRALLRRRPRLASSRHDARAPRVAGMSRAEAYFCRGPLSKTLDYELTCVAGIRRLPCRGCDPCRDPRIRRLPCREWADSVVGLGKAHDFLPYGLYKKALAREVI